MRAIPASALDLVLALQSARERKAQAEKDEKFLKPQVEALLGDCEEASIEGSNVTVTRRIETRKAYEVAEWIGYVLRVNVPKVVVSEVSAQQKTRASA